MKRNLVDRQCAYDQYQEATPDQQNVERDRWAVAMRLELSSEGFHAIHL